MLQDFILERTVHDSGGVHYIFQVNHKEEDPWTPIKLDHPIIRP